jgi:D-aminopeptidase
MCLCPGRDEKPLVVEALDEAVAFLVGEPRPFLMQHR